MTHDLSHWLNWMPWSDHGAETIAPRIFALKLDVPVLHVHSRRLIPDKNKLQAPLESWRELIAHPIEQLREIGLYLQRINAERIPHNKRREWIEQAMDYACPAIRKIYSESYKAQALPESHDRREGLLAAITVCEQLATGYKRLLSQDFALPDAGYARVRERVCLTGLRVLELVRTEQHLRAMRYQKLPAKGWRDCNRVFFSLSQCEDMDIHYPALNCLQVTLGRRANDLERRAPSMVSMNIVFLSIHVNGLLDSNTISSQKLHVVDVQIAHVIDSLTIIPDHGKALARGKVLIYPSQDCPAYFKRQDAKYFKLQREWLKERGEYEVGEVQSPESLKGVIIDVAPLDALLMAEHEKLLKQFESADFMSNNATNDSQKITKNTAENNTYDNDSRHKGLCTVADQDDLANLLTIDAMCDGLRLKQRKDQREHVIGQKILYVYNGFMSVYKLLVDMAAENSETPSELVEEHDLRDALAGRSALIASDLDANDSGQWFVVDRSAGGVHMKTRESQFTTALFIGQLVAFAYSREALKKPTIGYVVRLNRSLSKDIEVTIRILSHTAEATAVQSEFLSRSDMALPAILLRSRVEKRALASQSSSNVSQLVLHHSHRLSPGTPIQIESGEKQQEKSIAGLVQLQREFVISRLASEEETSASVL